MRPRGEGDTVQIWRGDQFCRKNYMGVWTHIEGEHTSKKASMKKIIESVLIGEDVVGTYDHNKFCVRFECGGDKVAKSIKRIIDYFKSFDKNARLELTATIEYGA